MKYKNILLLAIIGIFILGIFNCKTNEEQDLIDIVVGKWRIILTQTGYPSLNYIFEFFNDGRVTTGNYWGNWSLTGDVITVSGGIGSITSMTGKVTGTSMSGTWQNSKGTDGTFTANKI